MEFTGYLDFWFTDRPLIERVEPFAKLGVKRLDVWCWRLIDVAGLAEECKRHGSILNSTFDHDMGSLADPADNEKTLRTWAESLEMAERYNIEHLFIFLTKLISSTVRNGLNVYPGIILNLCNTPISSTRQKKS